MNGFAELELQNDVLIVKGRIEFDNVVSTWQKGLELMKKLTIIRVDLASVTDSDSSSLALLIEWTREAAKNHKKIVFLNIPKFVQDLARVSGIDTLLPSE